MNMIRLNRKKYKVLSPVYRDFVMSPRILLAILLISPLHTLAPHAYNWFLAQFSTCRSLDCTITIENTWFNLSLDQPFYVLMGIAFLAMFLRSLMWALFEVTAAAKVQEYFYKIIGHLKGIRAIWFDENPSGKVINQLFGDFGNLQRKFVISISDGQLCLSELIAGIIMVAVLNPIGVVPILLLWAVILSFQVKVNDAFDHVSDISSKRKGQVIEVLSDLIEGARVYRSYAAESHILQRLRKHIIEWTRVEFFQWRLMTWAWTWMWLLAEIGIAVVVFSAAWAFQSGHISAAVAGMVLIAAGQQQNIIGWTLQNIGEFLTSRSKGIRFLNLGHMPDENSEEFYHRQQDTNDETLPDEGDIVFRDFTASYREDSPVVLNKLNVRIPQGAKVALMGRTGAGKSTIIQALFRMLFVRSGDVLVGKESIYKSSAEKSREIFGIVPQNPWLFEGSLRDNIDVKREFSDDKILAILAEMELQHLRLDDPVSEGGQNFSVGERQVLCLARCLLSDKKIILMDEPTSNIDMETDAQIQKLIREKLSGRTLIVIAHRKETVSDFDQVIHLESQQSYA